MSTALELISARRSVRAFLPATLSASQLTEIFAAAQRAPSNCNTQPWQVHVASGTVRDTLQTQLLQAAQDPQRYAPDFPYEGRYEGIYRTRQYDAAAQLYSAMGIAREDKQGRQQSLLRNFAFFDAPHVAFIFLPEAFGLREAADCGMYAQTLMLAMAAHGVASCPQTALSFYPDVVRDVLRVAPGDRLLMGISFGFEDTDAAANDCRVGRAALDGTVSFHS